MATAAKRAGKLPEATRHFDDLPNSAHVRVGTVAAIWGCSKAQIWRLAAAGKIPKPIKFSERVTVWNVGQLRQARMGSAA